MKNPEASTVEYIIISMFISTALNVYLDLYLCVEVAEERAVA